MCVKVRGQFEKICSLFPPCVSWCSNSGHQAPSLTLVNLGLSLLITMSWMLGLEPVWSRFSMNACSVDEWMIGLLVVFHELWFSSVAELNYLCHPRKTRRVRSTQKTLSCLNGSVPARETLSSGFELCSVFSNFCTLQPNYIFTAVSLRQSQQKPKALLSLVYGLIGLIWKKKMMSCYSWSHYSILLREMTS